MKTVRLLLLAALAASPAPAAAQAYHNFAGNLAMSRVTMQPVDAQRRRALAASRGRYATPYRYGVRRYGSVVVPRYRYGYRRPVW